MNYYTSSGLSRARRGITKAADAPFWAYWLCSVQSSSRLCVSKCGSTFTRLQTEDITLPAQMARISGTILQTCSGTGRLAMENPNLQVYNSVESHIKLTKNATFTSLDCWQTVPKNRDFEVPVTQPGAGSRTFECRLRSCSHAYAVQSFLNNVPHHLCCCRSTFVARPGYILMTADYSQLELRILAHMSQDPVLIKALAEGDPFAELCAQWHGVSASQARLLLLRSRQ